MTMWTVEQVERGRFLAEQEARSNWDLGDLAAEVSPQGSSEVEKTLDAFGDEIGVSGQKLFDCRRVAMAWPSQHRVLGVAWSLHRELYTDPKRFEQLPNFVAWCRDGGYKPTRPNLWKFTGKKAWASETRARVPDGPVTPTADDIAHAVAQDPKLAEAVVQNKAARQALGTATERHYAGQRAASEHRREQDPVASQLDETSAMGQLISVLVKFSQQVGDIVPRLGKIEPGDVLLNQALERAEWAVAAVKTVAETGQSDMDSALELLLREGA